MFSHAFIKNHVNQIFRWYSGSFQRSSGLPVSYINGLSGRVVDPETLAADFGDYVPYLAYFGKSKEFSRYCQAQFLAVQKYIHQTSLRKRFFGIDLIKDFDFSDVLFGFYLCYLLDPREEIKTATLELLQGKIKPFFLGKNYTSFYLPQFHSHLPILNSLIGGYIEILVLWAEYLPGTQWLREAEKLADFLGANNFFRSCGLFPHHLRGENISLFNYFPFLKERQVTMMKNNTAIAWGFLELYKKKRTRKVREYLNHWLEGLEAVITPEGYVGQEIDFSKGEPSVRTITLAANFAVIDFLCDLAYFLQEPRALILAEKIADSWVKLQDPHTGLLPFYPGKQDSFLDSETDMVIALLKLSELSSGGKIYQRVAFNLAQGIFKYHPLRYGYALAVDIRSGKVTNPIVNVKFNALLLKLFVYSLEDGKIYKNRLLFELLKDR